nr:hypothetical protein BaRGS_032472 [Batillaria attramentaria]
MKRWMLTNKLKLNDDKSEALLCGTKPSRSKLQISSVHVGDAEIPLSESIKEVDAVHQEVRVQFMARQGPLVYWDRLDESC